MTVLFPGSFDPFTLGHADIVERTCQFADKVVIAIGVHPTKSVHQSPDERLKTISNLYADNDKVVVATYDCLTTDFAASVGATAIVRGVRSFTDFEYERTIAEVNRELTGIETILLFANPQYASISSSIVRELESYGKDISRFIP